MGKDDLGLVVEERTCTFCIIDYDFDNEFLADTLDLAKMVELCWII